MGLDGMPRGHVKFFNATKGFGFITADDGGGDIFVHISAVERAGLVRLNTGDEVSFEPRPDRQTGKFNATDLVLIARGGASARAGDRGDHGQATVGSQAGPGASRRGIVKWFNPDKGFGFIQPEGGGSDVFMHVSALERAGLVGLHDGQAIRYDLEADRRTGKMTATNLRLA